MNPYQELERLNIVLPSATTPVAAFVMATQTGNVVFVSGHIARKDGKPLAGQFGRDLTVQEGQAAARGIAVDLLATLHGFLGDLNRVTRILKLLCLVNSTPTFTEQHLVANGCSEVLLAVFGERGRHARSAFGVAQIPLGACIEIEMIVEVAPAA
ncbi:MAG TPA: RidA family protein [Steroidobacteraceae bacterium]|jgi:enamine deaminase RidA (YjgF/YER057c/UK114 family)|nr:RidA family protein [Steroidobacteraceae bacterium]